MRFLIIIIFVFISNCSGNKVTNYHGTKLLEQKYMVAMDSGNVQAQNEIRAEAMQLMDNQKKSILILPKETIFLVRQLFFQDKVVIIPTKISRQFLNK